MRERLGGAEVKDRDALAHRVFLLHGEAFISAKPERTTTVTSAPPRRRAVRQQSMAVLPPPSTTTRRPIDETWPKETLESQSMPMWMVWRLAAAGDIEVASSRRAAADENRVIALTEEAIEAVDSPFGDELAPGRERVADLLVDHFVGQAVGSGCASCRRRAILEFNTTTS